jgi:hypothetical protein
LKYKYGKKILEAHLDDGSKDGFVYVFGGSSVTAGHDNYYNQSYPKVFQRRLAPLFAGLGVGMEVRNIAVGSLGCEPYNACYEAFGGTDPDFVTWYIRTYVHTASCPPTLCLYIQSCVQLLNCN